MLLNYKLTSYGLTIRRSGIGTIDFNDDEFNENDKEDQYFCKNCEENGFKTLLTNRLYDENDLSQ